MGTANWARQLTLSQRLVRLAYRRGFTQRAMLESIGALIRRAAPDTVTPVLD